MRVPGTETATAVETTAMEKPVAATTAAPANRDHPDVEDAELKTLRATIAKDFHWEMGHRLPFHGGGCQNVHGHSYRMRVVVEGDLDENGMVIDYFDLKDVIDPIVDRVDHAFMVDESDAQMREFFDANPLRHVVVPFPTTAENITRWFLEQIVDRLRNYPNVGRISVRVHETERTYAEMEAGVGNR